MIRDSEEVNSRRDLAELCNRRDFNYCVEVGTDTGIFAAEFLRVYKGHWLFCIDSYEAYEDFNYDRRADLMMAVQTLYPFNGRVKIIVDRSPDCIGKLPPWFKPQFVYIDGAHDEQSVSYDLYEWWKVLPEGGILAGHDFDDTHPGVVKAVTEFAEELGRDIFLTRDPPQKSWYIFR